MLMGVKNQIKVCLLSWKYSLMREMINKISFFSQVIFMILNNASFIVQWLVLFSIKDDVGGYTFQQIFYLWGISSLLYGVSHFFFDETYSLSNTIMNGKLDSYLVQPKNVLISVITSDVDVSALGDMTYGYILLLVSGFTIKKFLLFTFLGIVGGLTTTAIIVIWSSLAFWIVKADSLAESINTMTIHASTYPEGIFNFAAKVILFTILPVGMTVYVPVRVLTQFTWIGFLLPIIFMIIAIALAFLVFYKGLKVYSSSNLMISKI